MNYIRFFISSTFTDMMRERDILNAVLTDLRMEFSKRNWMIEWIDLRWGISQEASLDNRTMRICLEELNRCRQLSPRPNFIILTGERYGWVPLPEVIPYSDIDLNALNDMEEVDYRLFCDWYLLDRNALPLGEFVLKPRRNEFIDNSVYESRIVVNLRRILPLICKGRTADKLLLSATAHEIYAGLDKLTAPDTFIYRRHLVNIPSDMREVFYDRNLHDSQLAKDIYSYVDGFVNEENTLLLCGDYIDYISGLYDKEIRNGMHAKLHTIISRVIMEREEGFSVNENEFHITLASEMTGHLVGRKDMLHRLKHYIFSEDRYPLLISAPSGIGKSSLMAMLVNNLRLKEDCVVVARFCGETADSSQAWSLLEGIFNDILPHTKNHRSRRGPVKLMRNDNQIDTRWSHESIFRLNCKRRVVVIIDSINSIDDSDAEFFFKFKWLDVPLSENIKVIVTCTPDKIFETSYDNIRCISLDGMGEESMKVVDNILARNQRTLSSAQYDTVKKAVAQSDQSGLYLNILANYLLDQPSWLIQLRLPQTVEGLLDLIFNHLRYPENHGERIVDLSLKLLACSVSGLSDDEILSLLASDEMLVNDVRSQAMHVLSPDSPTVPSIFWIRLQADLHGLIKKRQTQCGYLTLPAHSIIREYIYRNLMRDEVSRYRIYAFLFKFFYPLVSKDSPHAVYEIGPLCYQMVKCAEAINGVTDGSFENELNKCKSIFWNLLVDPEYIINKSIFFRADLIREYSEFGTVFKGESYSYEKLNVLGNEILSLPKSGDKEALKSFIYNLPDESELRRLVEPISFDNILIDALKNDRADHSVVHPAYGVENFPKISIDGNRVASLCANNTILKIVNYGVSVDNDIVIPLRVKGRKLNSDDMLKMHVVSADDCILLIESDTKKILKWSVMNAAGFLSSDGRLVTIVYAGGFLQYDRITGNQENFEMNIKEALPDSSGRFIWIIDGDGKLIRFDFYEDNFIGFKNAEGILFVTDELAVIRTSSGSEVIKHYVSNGNDKYRYYFLSSYTFVDEVKWYDRVSESLYLNFGRNLSQIKFVDDEITMINHGSQPDILAVKGEFALRISPLSIVRWRNMIESANIIMAFNKGIGSFSASEDGSIITMTLGVNVVQESYDYIIISDEKGLRKLHLPFLNQNFVIITSAAVSPDGKYIGASSNLGEIILVRRSDMSLIDSYSNSSSGCLGISFSSDSKKMLAVTGDFIADPLPIVHIGDTVVGKINRVDGQPDWENPENIGLLPSYDGESRFLQDGMLIRLGGLSIWDSKSKRMLLPPNVDIPFHYTDLPKNEHNSIGHGPRECIFEHPQSGLLLCSAKGMQTEIDLSNGTIRQYPNDKDLIGISADGNFLFYLDSKRNLWVYCGLFRKIIAEDIVAVYPSVFFPMEVFAYTRTGYILLVNIYGEQVAKAFVPDLWHAIPTTSGLAVATPRGPMLIASKEMADLNS